MASRIEPVAPARRSSRLQRAIEEMGLLGLEPEYARDLASDWFEVSERDLPASRAELQAAIKAGLGKLCRADATLTPRDALTPRMIAIVGPTGVGKTTTLAKIAAREVLESGRRVALITCDTFRIAAVEQLRMYARIIGIPLRVASSAAEMREALAASRDYGLVLIDTPGLAPQAQKQHESLNTILAVDARIERLLALSATTKTEEGLEAWKAFEPLGINRLIFCKIDESIRFGSLLPVMKTAKAPVAFLTNGQRVPEDLVGATPENLVQLFDAIPSNN
mgnify:CR=1 FL=1